MEKKFYRYDELLAYLDIFINKLSFKPSMIFIIMRDAYTKNEIEMSKYHIEMLVYNGNFDDYEWENDWYEGQSVMEIHAILTDKDILSIFGF